MKVLVTKANKSYWYRIKTFKTMKDIQRFIEKYGYGVIVNKNSYTNDRDFEFWDGMKTKDIPIIKKCPLEITIYNDYVE